MKKILALLLAICTLAIFSACNPSNQVYQVYANGNEKMNQLNSFDMSSDISMNMQAQGTSFDIPIKMDIKANNIKSNPEYLVGMSTAMLGADATSQIYYKDGYLYASSAGTKYKQAMSLEDMKKDYVSVNVDILDQELLQQAVLTRTNVGSTITVALTGDALKSDSINKIFNIDSMLQSFGTVGTISFNNFLATLTYNNEGYLTSEVVEYEMSCTIDNTPLIAKVKGTFNINNPGQTVTITPPTDLSSYTLSN